MDLRTLLAEPGLGDYPEFLRPYVAPLTRSLAAPPGSKMLPSRTGLSETAAQHFGDEDNPTEWTPWGFQNVSDAPRMSSGPLAGRPTRPAIGTAVHQNEGLWNLSGVATGWSKPYAPTPGRPPAPKMALGTWTPFSGAKAPLPGNPTPAQMLSPAVG